MERYARTKSTEVINRARKAFFDDSEIVPAYQYSAIIDGRTTNICAGLHGKIFDKDKAPTPPLHFNCRSTLIPVTRFEKFKVDKTRNTSGSVKLKGGAEVAISGPSNIDAFIDEKIGEGFSRN